MPECHVLSDVALAAFGKRGEFATQCVVYFYIGGVTVIFHLTSAQAVASVANGADVCSVLWSVLVGVVVLMFMQIRDIHEIGGLALVGAVSIFVPLIIILVQLITAGSSVSDDKAIDDYDDETRIVGRIDSSSFVTMGVGFMDIIFAFAGQVIFMELQSGMKNPAEFPKAVKLSSLVMVTSYTVAAGVAYSTIGSAILINGDPMTSDLAKGTSLYVVNFFLAVHVMIAYVIEGNVLARGVLKMLKMDSFVDGNTVTDRMAWFGTTVAIVFGAFILSNVVPFFSDLMGLMGALCAILLTYTVPIACATKLLPMEKIERRFAFCFLPFSLLVGAAGTACSVLDILTRLSEVSKEAPFSCS
jgi:hypothetical protein